MRLIVIDKLVGIYNANGSVIGELKYLFGKLTGQSDCALCDITHGPFRGKADFRDAQQALDIPFENLHLDELEPDLQSFRNHAPCIVAICDSQYSLLVSSAELARCCGDANQLFEVIKAKVL
tara:strand:- start:1031 stop:1396 length:366 start_codon:yes stop_codon:yes gene_type:complete